MVFQRQALKQTWHARLESARTAIKDGTVQDFFFNGFVHLLATSYSPAQCLGWIFFFFLMRHSLGVFGKQSAEAIYSLPPRALRLPSNHPGLCCSLPYFLPPGVLSGQFLTAMVFICRVVPGRITSPGKPML